MTTHHRGHSPVGLVVRGRPAGREQPARDTDPQNLRTDRLPTPVWRRNQQKIRLIPAGQTLAATSRTVAAGATPGLTGTQDLIAIGVRLNGIPHDLISLAQIATLYPCDHTDSLTSVLSEVVPYHAAISANCGLRLVMSQGGSRVVAYGAAVDGPALTDFFTALNFAPQIGTLDTGLVQGWSRLSPEPFNAFAGMTRPIKSGSRGALRPLTDDNFRWQALATGCPTCWASQPPPAFTIVANSDQNATAERQGPELGHPPSRAKPIWRQANSIRTRPADPPPPYGLHPIAKKPFRARWPDPPCFRRFQNFQGGTGNPKAWLPPFQLAQISRGPGQHPGTHDPAPVPRRQKPARTPATTC